MLKEFVIALISLIILDFVWLGLVSKKFYKKEFDKMIKTKFNIPVAMLVYLFLAFGLAYFIILPGQSLTENIIRGALFGLIVYGVYDFTNYSILKNYSIKLMVVDILWGTFLLATTSLVVSLF